MGKIIKLANKEECFGCAACHDICPKECITMSFVSSLHKYPVIDEKVCIKCGKCMQVCPVISKSTPDNYPQKYYAAWNKDPEDRINSTSGGIGTALARFAIMNKWVVYGAAFDNHFTLKHKKASTSLEIKGFYGSKYLQSDIEGCYLEIKKLIKDGHHVLFIGTPCQVEAIKNYIGTDKDNLLITCAIICHGVNSPIVWNDYVKYLETKHRSKITSYNFRSKKKGWGNKKNGDGILNISYETTDNKTHFEPAKKNIFHVWFGKHLILRRSCIQCPFRIEQRNADITIGDFWGIESILHNLEDVSKGVSIIITSSRQGEEIIKKNQLINYIEVDKGQSIKALKGYIDTKPLAKKKRDIEKLQQFEKDYLSSSFHDILKKYPIPSFIKRLMDYIKYRCGIKSIDL